MPLLWAVRDSNPPWRKPADFQSAPMPSPVTGPITLPQGIWKAGALPTELRVIQNHSVGLEPTTPGWDFSYRNLVWKLW